MPGMPIFQDSPSQLKGQIYVLDSVAGTVVPLAVNSTGSLSTTFAAGSEVSLAAGTDIDNVASLTTLGTVTNDVKIVNGTSALTVGLAAGTDIDSVTSLTTLGTVTNDVKIINGTTPLTVGLATGTDIDTVASLTTLGTVTNDVKIINGTTPLTVGLATGTDIDNVASLTTLGTVTNDVKIINGTTALNVGLSAGTNLIGKVQNHLVFNNEDSFGAGTPLTSKAVALSATVNSDTQDISKETSYNWFLKNTGTTGATQNITVKVEISPDGTTNWLEDTGTDITIPFGESKMITVNNFLQYARFVITGGTADTTVISCFQAQH